jgi:hypothetical protein
VLGCVDVGANVGLMLHDDYAGAYTTWVPISTGGGVLVGDVAYKGDESIDALSAVPETAWQRIERTFRVGAGGAALFDGAWPGDEFAETDFAVELASGDYHVDALPAFTRGEVVIRCVRLTPAFR